MSDILRCPRCGRSVNKLLVCEDCSDDLSREGRHRIARTITGCARCLAAIILLCTKVILTGGQDKASMAKAMSYRDTIDELDRALKELDEGAEAGWFRAS